MPNRHIVRQGKKWLVKEPDNSKPLSWHRTQGNAENAAKRDLKGIGGQVIIHRPNGQIRDADTVKPGNDPNPPRDAKY